MLYGYGQAQFWVLWAVNRLGAGSWISLFDELRSTQAAFQNLDADAESRAAENLRVVAWNLHRSGHLRSSFELVHVDGTARARRIYKITAKGRRRLEAMESGRLSGHPRWALRRPDTLLASAKRP